MMCDRYLESFASFSEAKTYLPKPDPEEARHIFEAANAKVDIKRVDDYIAGTPITNLKEFSHP